MSDLKFLAIMVALMMFSSWIGLLGICMGRIEKKLKKVLKEE